MAGVAAAGRITESALSSAKKRLRDGEVEAAVAAFILEALASETLEMKDKAGLVKAYLGTTQGGGEAPTGDEDKGQGAGMDRIRSALQRLPEPAKLST